jgi:hypothetical protein
LTDILKKYETLPARPAPARSSDGREDPLGEAFDRVVRDVIRPEMESLGAALTRRGHEFEILIEPGQQITMRIYPALYPRSAYATVCRPYVAFSRDAATSRIHVVQSTMMPCGRGCAVIGDTVSPFQLTRPQVAALVLDVLENVQRAEASTAGATT